MNGLGCLADPSSQMTRKKRAPEVSECSFVEPTGKPVGRNPEREPPAMAEARVEGSIIHLRKRTLVTCDVALLFVCGRRDQIRASQASPGI